MNRIEELIHEQRSFYGTHQLKVTSVRIQALKKFKKALDSYEDKILAALKNDLNKSSYDAYSTEIAFVHEEINFILKHLHSWMEPKRVKTAKILIGSKSYIYPEPRGVVLIIAPWNYPFQLAVLPMLGAIAAGNCVIVKPSELTPHTSQVIKNLISDTFEEEHIAVVEGGVEVTQQLLQQKLDYIFFTGSIPVGKIVMQAAAKHLTPVTLELGGKSPCIIHEDANLKVAAKRVAWGKFLNAGQTCVAPDYIYVHEKIKSEFCRLLIIAIKEMFGESLTDLDHFTRIVSHKHFQRLTTFLETGKIIHGGSFNEETLLIEPTIIEDVSWDDHIMQDEIFGPILPILEYQDMTTVIDQLVDQKPLALYLFSEDKKMQERVLSEVSFGGGCINDTILHLASPYLPFGGVGNSGIGAYHGKASFDTFSHYKSIVKQTTRFDIPVRYPNFKHAFKLMKQFIK